VPPFPLGRPGAGSPPGLMPSALPGLLPGLQPAPHRIRVPVLDPGSPPLDHPGVVFSLLLFA